MEEGQFQLGDTVWGDGTELIVEGGDMPMPEVRDEDAENPLGHGGFAGRDRLGFTSWSWDLATDTGADDDPRHALHVFEDLADTWRESINLAPGELLPLRYRVFGRTRRVYGRPRRLDTPKPDLLTRLGQARGAIDFKLFDPFTYDDVEQSIVVGQIGTEAGVLVWPFTWPALWGVQPGQSAGVLDVGGRAPTPLMVDFRGPVTNPWLRIGDWTIGLVGTVAAGKTVTVDTRAPGSITLNGQSVRTMLAQNARLSGRVKPGPTQVSYGGMDPTNSSSVMIRWRSAYYSI